LQEYREGAEQLFTSRAQRPLNQALRAVDESKRAIRDHLLRASDWGKLQQQRSEAAAETARLRQEGGRLTIELDRLKRIRENRQDLSLRDALLVQIAGLFGL
jgi:hypothetical protein